MQTIAFVSSWIPPTRLSSTTALSSRCATTPSMTLLSHEKVQVLTSSPEVEIAKYKLEIEIPGTFSKERRRQSIQGVKKQANFPGFRKGTIPPYAMREIESFVLQECTSEMIGDALRELDLSNVDGDDGDPEMDMDEMSSNFKIGENFAFTCEIQTKQVITGEPAENLEDIVTTSAELEKVDMFKDREEEGATA